MIERLAEDVLWMAVLMFIIFWTFVLLDELTCGGGLWADVLCI